MTYLSNESFETLIEMILYEDTHQDIRNDAIEELVERDDPQTQAVLANALKVGNEQSRIYAAYALCNVADDSVLNELREASTDTSPRIRCYAIEGILNAGGIKMLSEIVSFLDDPDEEVIDTAISAFGKYGDQSHIDLLVPTLKHNSAIVRRRSLLTIAHLGGEGAIEILKSVLGDDDKSVHLAAIDAIKRILNDKSKIEKIITEWRETQG